MNGLDSTTPSNRYLNRVHELQRVKNSSGEIVIIDALSGYGKTAFLEEITRRFINERAWLVFCIATNSEMQPRDILTRIMHYLSDENADDTRISSSADLLTQLAHSPQLENKGLAILFDDVHKLTRDTLVWLQKELAPNLMDELYKISRGHCLLVFSGYNITNSPGFRPPYRSIPLLPFNRNTIEEFIEAVPNDNFQFFLRNSANNKKWLIKKLVNSCGGHPRSLLKILREIESGRWLPHPIHSEETYQDIFKEYVLREVENLISGLNDSYCKILKSLCVYRSINSNIVKAIQQDADVANNDDPLTVTRKLRNHKLVVSDTLSKKKVLDPLIRNGLTTHLMMDNHQRYVKLNETAFKAYKDWLESFDETRPFEDALDLARDAIYHCLCHSRLRQDLRDCLRFISRCLDNLLAIQEVGEGITSKQEIIDHVRDDEDIQTMLSDYSLVIEDELDALEREEFPSFSKREDAVSYKYDSGIVAILDGEGVGQNVVGTGFLSQYDDRWLVITCTHVLQKLSCQQGSTLHLRHYLPKIGNFTAEVLKYNPPDSPPIKWTAYQDVAILEPLTPSFSDNIRPFLLSVDEQPNYPVDKKSICFGYAQDRVDRGTRIEGLSYLNPVANGFVVLRDSKSKVKPGVSGAPWGHRDTETIVGMVQSIYASSHTLEDEAYLIPAPTILQVVKDYFSSEIILS